MKAAFDRLSLQNALAAIGPAVPSRTPKPILTSAKLTVGSSNHIEATDLEVSIRHALTNVDVYEPGPVMVPFARLKEIVGTSTDATIKLESDYGKLVVRGERSIYKLQVEDPQNYPVFELGESEKTLTILAATLKQSLVRSEFASDQESSRYALNGVLFDVNGSDVKLVSTDGRRLAVCRGAAIVHRKPPEDVTYIVPSKACDVLERSLSGDDDVVVRLSASKAVFEHPNWTIATRLCEGRFPRYKEVIPTGQWNTASLDLSVQDLFRSFRQASLCSSVESVGVNVTIHDGKMILNGQAAEVGQSEVEFPVSYNGDKLTITFDPKYVTQMLKVLDQDGSVTFKMKDGMSVAMFETDGFQYALMPLAKSQE